MKVIINLKGVNEQDMQHLLNRMRKSKFTLTLQSTNRRLTGVYAKDIPKDKVDSIKGYCVTIKATVTVQK
jgi:hypothetical protein